MKLSALIPAKRNSRRFPNKNYHFFFGKPIYEWIKIEAKKAEIFSEIYVSSDDDRPEELCADNIKIEEVLKYHIETGDLTGNYICVLYPCAYGITAEHIIDSFLKMIKANKEYCYSYGMVNGDYQLDNGGFYWVKKEAFLRDNAFITPDAVKYEAPQVDINTLEDFIEAKLDVYKNYRKRFLNECECRDCQNI